MTRSGSSSEGCKTGGWLKVASAHMVPTPPVPSRRCAALAPSFVSECKTQLPANIGAAAAAKMAALAKTCASLPVRPMLRAIAGATCPPTASPTTAPTAAPTRELPSAERHRATQLFGPFSLVRDIWG